MLLADKLSAELCVGHMRHTRENVFEHLKNSDDNVRSHDGLRNTASNLGRLLVDLPENMTEDVLATRPRMPRHLREPVRDDFDLAGMTGSASMRSSVADRVVTPFRWSEPNSMPPTPLLTPGPAGDRGDTKGPRYPSPAFGRIMRIPAPPDVRSSSSRGGLTSSRSVPSLNFMPPNDPQLAAKIAKMKQIALKGDPALFLKIHPVNMGLPAQMATTYTWNSTRPVQMAMDPKWSTDLRKIDVKIGKKFKYENRMSAAGTTTCPEVRYLEKDYEEGWAPKAIVHGLGRVIDPMAVRRTPQMRSPDGGVLPKPVLVS